MRLAKPFHVVCTWRFWQQPSYLWNHLILQVCWEMCFQRGLGASRSAACVVICPFLGVLVLPWRSLRKSLTAQELCCNCDPKILMYWCNYWIQHSCSCDHHVGELCLHSCSCSLTPSMNPGGIPAALMKGGAALLTCIPLCICFLSAGFIQPHNPANK